jgi:two-component system, OmpR family, response regulator
MPGGQRAEAARILVVDDEASIVDAVATALRYEGFAVEEARNGGDALAAVERFKPNLLILDWRLPDIEGIDVCRRLRARGLETPILFLTATDGVEDKAEALTAGGSDYVTKPFSLDEISTRAHAILLRASDNSPGSDHSLQGRTSTQPKPRPS